MTQVKVHWVQVCTYPAFDKVEAHRHGFFHYLYIIRGTGEIEIDGVRHTLQPKHMYLMAPGVYHAFWNTREDRLVTCEIKFQIFDTVLNQKLEAFPPVVDVGDTPILGILQNIRRETAGKKNYAGDIIAMNMQEICIHLQRASGQLRQESGQDTLVDVISYIENNLDCDINLQDLANIVRLEKTYFLKKFKQVTGTTPMAYTRNERIKKARELLIYSDMSITQIAGAVGFQTVHHFSRHFAKVMGMSPSKYKESKSME